MKPLTVIFFIFLSFGLVAAGVFPFYADFFVEWKPGMLRFFVLGCVVAGIFVGAGNFFVFKGILSRLKSIIAEAASLPAEVSIPRRAPDDLYNSFINMFISSIEQLKRNKVTAEEMGRQLAHEVEETGRVIEHVGTIARKLQGETTLASQSALSGTKNVNETFDGCRQINDHLEQAIAKMHLFENTFNEIISAAKNISAIAMQTDILSTNASITAAHAGEVGREFSVVANDVRKLAASSRQVTTAIDDSLFRAKTEITTALTAMSTASEEFSRRSTLFKVAEENLGTIQDTTRISAESLSKVLHKLAELTALSERMAQSAQVFLVHNTQVSSSSR